MQWLDHLMNNPHIEGLLLANSDGGVLHSTRPLRSEDERVASMLQAVEVLAQTLSEAVRCGRLKSFIWRPGMSISCCFRCWNLGIICCSFWNGQPR